MKLSQVSQTQGLGHWDSHPGDIARYSDAGGNYPGRIGSNASGHRVSAVAPAGVRP
jgi:hypothetical protein